MGWFTIEHYKGGELSQTFVIENDVTLGGRLHLLESVFEGTASKFTTWRLGLIDAASFSTLSESDAHPAVNHPGWVEIQTLVGDSNAQYRQWWRRHSTAETPERIASGQFRCGFDLTTISSVSPVPYFVRFAAQYEVKGLFMSSLQGIGQETPASGVLFCTAVFSANIKVSVGDAFRVAYQLDIQGDIA
jgi:hypothetical protein